LKFRPVDDEQLVLLSETDQMEKIMKKAKCQTPELREVGKADARYPQGHKSRWLQLRQKSGKAA
jgi:hypothetical protein